MLHLLKMWLKAPVEETDERGHRRMSGGKKATRGTPQGGVVSPLLANIYMHRFIKAFRKYGLDRRYGAVLVTYADDFVVLCRHGADRGPRDDAAMDGQHRARAERDQDACVQRPMRVLRFPRLHLRSDVLTANRRTLQRCAAFEEGRRLHQGRDPPTAAAREPGAVGGGGRAT